MTEARVPPQVRMGLLDYLNATALEEDYAVVAARRGTAPAGPASERSGGPGRLALVALAAFGVLVATAAVQTARGADDAAARKTALVRQVEARKTELAALRTQVAALERETDTLERKLLEATTAGRSVRSRLTRLGVLTGATAVQGPGVRVVTDDGPTGAGPDAVILDVDLQRLVNGLWLAGAEAISVNGHRVTALTAIRQAGASITVNLRPVAPPYTVSAIGDPDTLAARFVETAGGQWWLDLQALYGVTFEITTVTEGDPMTLPATDLALRYAGTPEVLR